MLNFVIRSIDCYLMLVWLNGSELEVNFIKFDKFWFIKQGYSSALNINRESMRK